MKWFLYGGGHLIYPFLALFSDQHIFGFVGKLGYEMSRHQLNNLLFPWSMRSTQTLEDSKINMERCSREINVDLLHKLTENSNSFLHS